MDVIAYQEAKIESLKQHQFNSLCMRDRYSNSYLRIPALYAKANKEVRHFEKQMQKCRKIIREYKRNEKSV